MENIGEVFRIIEKRKDIPEKLHPICQKCMARMKEKYDNFTAIDGSLYKDGFQVPCNFIPFDENYIPIQLRGLVPVEANAIFSPLLWAEQELIDPESGDKWKARPYQRAPLMCSSQRMVLRCGRRVGKTVILAILILWYLYTSGGGLKHPETGKIRSNLKLLLATPYKSQTEDLFNRIRAFLTANPKLRQGVMTDTKGSPQCLALYGTDGGLGNSILGFAAGADEGSDGGAIRGQDADVVFLDEAAYIPESVIVPVINPLLITKTTSRLIASSTPSEIPEDYYQQLCTQNPRMVEFYTPSTERPDWAIMEPLIRGEYLGRTAEWDREILALFTSAGMGVFREDFTRAAQTEYQYGDIKPSPNFVTTFGVDWNKEKGTEISIAVTSKISPHLTKIAWTEHVPKKDFSTAEGVSRIVHLARQWSPDSIYVDTGGGDGGGMLRNYGRSQIGKNLQDARLMTIVKDFDFGSALEVREQSGKLKKHPAKRFLIEHFVYKTETHTFQYSFTDTTLTKQLNNYIVARRQANGNPVYAAKDPKIGDHRLDAVALSLIALRLEFPSFYTEDVQGSKAGFGFIPSSKDDGLGTTVRTPPSIRGISIHKSQFVTGRSSIAVPRRNTNSPLFGDPKYDDELFGRKNPSRVITRRSHHIRRKGQQ